MTSLLSKKDLILLGAVAVAVATLLPVLAVSFLIDRPTQSKPAETLATDIVDTSDEALILQCRQHIGEITETSFEDTRIDRRSTGMRDTRFNVHGFVRQNSEEFDFQCWFDANRILTSHYIGRVSLQAIQRQKSLGTTNTF